jgi:hypothetical protein
MLLLACLTVVSTVGEVGCYKRSYPLARVTRDAIYMHEPAEPLEIIGEGVSVQEEECAFQLPLVVLSRADVIRVVENLFRDNPGDAIIDAELYMFHLPLIVWDDSCVGIRGRMVRTRKGGAPPG